MKLVALDVGEKRIGVATADSAVRIAVPHSTVLVDGSELAKIADILKEESARHLIVGLPRNAAGDETAQSQKVRDFVKTLQGYLAQHKVAKPLVKFQDESLTSVMAEENLARNKRKKLAKSDIDREAATIILQDFLDSFSGEIKSEAVVDAKKKPKMKHRAFRVFAVIVGLSIVAAVVAITWYAENIKPVASEIDCKGVNPEAAEKCETLSFVITQGDSTDDIIGRLEADGIIRSALAFKIYVRVNHDGAVFRAGSYELSNSMTIAEIINELAKGSSAETFRITFLPGGTVADAKKRLLDAGYAEDKIDTALSATYDHPLLVGKPDDGSLEGYIFGETYEFYKAATVEEILESVFDLMYSTLKENNIVAGFDSQGLSMYEGINLASIVQREARSADQSGVAQVFLNRLRKNIPLGSDVVIEYRAVQLGIDKSNLSIYTNKNVLGCPWSSRFCTGLPATPISTPSVSALLAVANPDAAHSNDLYFLTGDDNKMYYATSQAGHEANIRNHCKVMCY